MYKKISRGYETFNTVPKVGFTNQLDEILPFMTELLTNKGGVGDLSLFLKKLDGELQKDTYLKSIFNLIFKPYEKYEGQMSVKKPDKVKIKAIALTYLFLATREFSLEEVLEYEELRLPSSIMLHRENLIFPSEKYVPKEPVIERRKVVFNGKALKNVGHDETNTDDDFSSRFSAQSRQKSVRPSVSKPSKAHHDEDEIIFDDETQTNTKHNKEMINFNKFKDVKQENKIPKRRVGWESTLDVRYCYTPDPTDSDEEMM